jgi:putative membrane protein insertion efficiency factor
MLKKLPKALALLFIASYRSVGSAWLGGACRFEPSCSQYATEAFSSLPFFSALKVSAVRISKCRPGGGFGFDPVKACNGNCKGQHE